MTQYPSNSLIRRIAVQAPEKLAADYIRIVNALKKYGRHLNECQAISAKGGYCSCGLDTFDREVEE